MVCYNRWKLVAKALVAQLPIRRNLIGLRPRLGLVGLLVGGYPEVEVEVAIVTGRPVEAPAHSLSVSEQLFERSARDTDHRYVTRREVWENSVEAVGRRRTLQTAGSIPWPKHEMVNDELRASMEEVRQQRASLLGFESILLVDRNPRQLLPLSSQLIAAPTPHLSPLAGGTFPRILRAKSVRRG